MAQWTRGPWLIGLSMGAYSVLTGIRASYQLGSLDGIHAVEIAQGLGLLLLAYRIERQS
jgi:hypothetical protein